MNRPFTCAAALALAALAAVANPAAAQQTTPAPAPAPTPAAAPAPAAQDTQKARPPRVRRQRDLIVREEFQERNFSNTYDLVQSLRPAWLRATRGMGTMGSGQVLPTVYMDGARLGGIGTLRSINPLNVTSIQYLGIADATTRFGGDNMAPAIIVDTR